MLQWNMAGGAKIKAKNCKDNVTLPTEVEWAKVHKFGSNNLVLQPSTTQL